jgi:hypothetical protein
MHLPQREYPLFAADLGKAIQEIDPDVICAEISPEQLAGTQTCDSKPEQRDIVMPLARQLGIRVVPIQPSTQSGLALEHAKNAVEAQLQRQKNLASAVEYSRCLTRFAHTFWLESAKSAGCFENIQTTEMHEHSYVCDRVEETLFPDRARLMIGWNESMLQRIEDTIVSSPHSRILVIVGLWHKYWLWNRLRARGDIEVHNLQTFHRTKLSEPGRGADTTTPRRRGRRGHLPPTRRCK